MTSRVTIPPQETFARARLVDGWTTVVAQPIGGKTMSYEAEKTRLIEEFESVVGAIRSDYGLKGKPSELDAKAPEPQAQPRPTGRH